MSDTLETSTSTESSASSIPHLCSICGGSTHVGIGPLLCILCWICDDPECGFEEPIPE